ncbi:amidohydrolase [Aminithiophilus ramosus]|uniref:Amidohydrolase n=2 Tax=Synergistales TaxID=649776 RepID=A0A9Q7AQ87_9BACT|nr:amidohydrolase [Aminithiophilus ramosus]QTX33283.1 amidohydrolase [Aminithiophilus ramosus]QVL36969.1 amidohydrolase [Synergistota bacterium]
MTGDAALFPGVFLEEAREGEAQLVAWRRHLHRHPELAYEERETSLWVAKRLEEMGIADIRLGCEGFETGVVADIGGKGPLVALRADMDALPVTEETGLPFASEVAGRMHACGHDAHVAILLGAARILALRASSLSHRVRLIFQPSEEAAVPRPGAEAMIASGALKDVEAIFGLHVWQPLEAGLIGWSDGALMASSDRWTVTIEGRGGHGAMPHEAVDPTVAAGSFLMALQTVVSRQTDPLESIVVSVGSLRSGEAFNVIPDRVVIEGTARTLSPELRDGLPERIERIAVGTARAFRCGAVLDYRRNLPPVVNDEAMAGYARFVAETLFGSRRLTRLRPTMAGEDFSFYLEKVPGAFLLLGMGGRGGADWPHHHPRFQVDESVLAEGAALLASLAWRFPRS